MVPAALGGLLLFALILALALAVPLLPLWLYLGGVKLWALGFIAWMPTVFTININKQSATSPSWRHKAYICAKNKRKIKRTKEA